MNEQILEPRKNLKESFLPMIHGLDMFLKGEKKESASKDLAESILDISDSVVCMVLIQKKDTEFGKRVFHHLIREMEFDRFEKLLTEIKCLEEKALSEEDDPPELENIQKTYQDMIDSDKGQRLKRDTLENLLYEFRSNEDGKRKNAAKKLVKLGAVSAEPLLEMLKNSEDRYERSRIIQVLSDIGPASIPAMRGFLQDDTPWYFVRNLMLLFGRAGNRHHLQIIRPMLEHNDLRVQREALFSICNIGGKESEEIVLSALFYVNDKLKLDIVGMLGKIGSHEAVGPLVKLLNTIRDSASATDIGLIEKICMSLGSIGAKEAIPALNAVAAREQEPESSHKAQTMAAVHAAKTAISMIREKQTKSKDFYLKTWSTLFDSLTKEEADALYHSLKEVYYETDAFIYHQGEINFRLFFVHQGNLVLAYDQDDEDIWIKTVKPGDIAGYDSFFQVSLTTTSLLAATDARVNYLDRHDLSQIQEKFPFLEEKLRRYCITLDNLSGILKENGMERRAHPRARINPKVSVQFLDASGKPEGKMLRGDIHDISAGGLSFSIQSSRELSHQLLDRLLNVKFILQTVNSDLEIDQNGTVVSASAKSHNRLFIHLRLDSKLIHLPSARVLSEIYREIPGEEEEEKDEFLKTRL